MDQNMAVVRSLLAAPRTLHPDALQRQPRNPTLIVVGRPVTIGSGPNRVVLYPIRASTTQVLMTYFPEPQLLYTADMTGPFDPGAAFSSPQGIWELQSEVQHQGIKVNTIIGLHLLQTPWSKLETQVREIQTGH
jgi:hypothetical protein